MRRGRGSEIGEGDTGESLRGGGAREKIKSGREVVKGRGTRRRGEGGQEEEGRKRGSRG